MFTVFRFLISFATVAFRGATFKHLNRFRYNNILGVIFCLLATPQAFCELVILDQNRSILVRGPESIDLCRAVLYSPSMDFAGCAETESISLSEPIRESSSPTFDIFNPLVNEFEESLTTNPEGFFSFDFATGVRIGSALSSLDGLTSDFIVLDADDNLNQIAPPESLFFTSAQSGYYEITQNSDISTNGLGGSFSIINNTQSTLLQSFFSVEFLVTEATPFELVLSSAGSFMGEPSYVVGLGRGTERSALPQSEFDFNEDYEFNGVFSPFVNYTLTVSFSDSDMGDGSIDFLLQPLDSENAMAAPLPGSFLLFISGLTPLFFRKFLN